MTDNAPEEIVEFIVANIEVLAYFLHNHIGDFDHTEESFEKAYKMEALKGYTEYQAACSKLKGPYSGRKKTINTIIRDEVLHRFCHVEKEGDNKLERLLTDEKHLNDYGSYLVTLLNLPEHKGTYLTNRGCKSLSGLASAVLEPVGAFLKAV